ncbi:MAG: class I SAM-dependent methyltransferase [Acidobacteriota bacterium]
MRAGVTSGDLLDVGAGVGVLSFELLQAGLSRAVAVDASRSYVAAGREEAARRGLPDAVTWIEGDFVDVAGRLSPAAVVTLDRVVCCYAGYEPLLRAAVRLARRCVALSYPRARWTVGAGLALENLTRYLSGNPFRTYLHPPSALAAIVGDAGFTLASRSQTWTWAVDVYVKAA